MGEDVEGEVAEEADGDVGDAGYDSAVEAKGTWERMDKVA